ncbi:hypothetical protein I302_102312 [Kwoniella bestiolae CBS 10118]|uniref:Uncharacterized protein n=1 Tax=Kwoniella bestiolae CBS 10118 TaxID=1296100 RepID=A0A1B9GEQ5_9TREE|nr:hypothetical protein I302_01004 [Kwoniella bestiolae CBS 10118]OCF29497.1 hypothetical protein I302_01004 [Kwoniella bestiolae CBS 10118]
MKTSTSFAVLALLAASASTTFAAPLPHHSNHKDAEVQAGHRGGHHHARAEHPANHHIVDANVKLDMITQRPNGKHGDGKHHHARADSLAVTKPLPGALGVPTADNLGTGSKNVHKMGKTKNTNSQPLKVLSPTSDSIHSALKPQNSDTTKVGQQLNHPNSGNIGQLGKTADDALEPQETNISKNVLPRDVVSSVTGGNGAAKPVQTAATGLGKNVATVNNGGKSELPIVGSTVKPITNGNTSGVTGAIVKPVTSGANGVGNIAPPSLTSGLLNSKGGALDLSTRPLGTDGGLVGTTGNAVTGVTGTLTNGQGSLVNSQTVTGTVGKLPNAVGGVVDGANVDPISNQAYQVNTDDTESDVKSSATDKINQTNDNGLNQTTKKVNSSAFKNDGTKHRVDGHGGDGTKDRGSALVSDNSSNAKQTGNDTTGVNSQNVNPTVNQVTNTNNNGNTAGGLKKTGDKAVDQTTDQAIPSNSQKNSGTLVTANNDSGNAKIIQTPGKSNKVAEANSNDVTGSKSTGDNVNVKVAVPQHQATSGATNNKTGGNGGILSNGDKIGPNDHKGNVLQEVGNGKILKQNIVAPSAAASAKPHSQAASASGSAHSHAAAASHSASKANAHPSSVRPQVFVEYTSFASSPSSTIASKSASITSSSSTTPLAQAHVHSGTIQVNKNQHSTDTLKLPLTSSLHLPLPSTTSKTLKTASTKPRQAQVTYGQKGEHVVACDGQVHQPNDVIDECIKADLLDYKPDQTEACPTDMQHDVQYGVSTDMLKNNQNQQANKEIQKYVRLCLKASAL